ncbi:uncharacterized protein LOC135389379 [Ornithodoros turicata]|uniref:uncharacterized protein LOC135389379 n=1 Tax=Ornithodoros turicata TaxID=34597 RepID=UPI003138B219
MATPLREGLLLEALRKRSFSYVDLVSVRCGIIVASSVCGHDVSVKFWTYPSTRELLSVLHEGQSSEGDCGQLLRRNSVVAFGARHSSLCYIYVVLCVIDVEVLWRNGKKTPAQQWRSTTLTVEQRVLMPLRFYTTGALLGNIAHVEYFATTKGPVSESIHAVSLAVIKNLAPKCPALPANTWGEAGRETWILRDCRAAWMSSCSGRHSRCNHSAHQHGFTFY